MKSREVREGGGEGTRGCMCVCGEGLDSSCLLKERLLLSVCHMTPLMAPALSAQS